MSVIGPAHPVQRVLKQRAWRRGVGALVVVLGLVGLLAAAGTGMALASMAAGSEGRAHGRTFEHELAVEGLIAVLPGLLESAEGGGRDEAGRLPAVTVGQAQVTAVVRPYRPQVVVEGGADVEAVRGKLEAAAREHGLNYRSIVLRPAEWEAKDVKLPAFVCVDQLLTPSRFDEVYRRHAWDEPPQSAVKEQAVWSDLVGFGITKREKIWQVEVTTTIGADARYWFLLCRVADESVEVVWRVML